MLGYQSRAEHGLIRPAAQTESRVQLVPIGNDTDWSPKQAAGYFTLYLVKQDGVACGSVGVNCTGKLLRLKNLVVASAHRRRGVGAAILDALASMAHARGLAAVGCFSIPEGPGDAFYRGHGFREAIVQVGWDRTLNLTVPARLARRRVHAYS